MKKLNAATTRCCAGIEYLLLSVAKKAEETRKSVLSQLVCLATAKAKLKLLTQFKVLFAAE
jgi:hypothetical protein